MQKVLRHIALLGCLFSPGCALLPQIAHQPTVHNPFPQLSRVAVAPFFNQSNEPTVDGRRIALAYFNELQLVPGFEVVPVELVEKAMLDHRLAMQSPADARLLAQILKADAVVIGAVTDYSPYYPPRIALHVEWYAANPNFHPIPPGYGLPWGTPEERDIPAPLVFEAEMALAKAQLKTQTPPYEKLPDPGVIQPLSYQTTPGQKPAGKAAAGKTPAGKTPADTLTADRIPVDKGPADKTPPGVLTADRIPADKPGVDKAPADKAVAAGPLVAVPGAGLPPDWPDPRGFIPPPPSRRLPPSCPSDAPVLQHTRTYNGNDMEFTEALASYYFFRDDARFGGWQNYLERSDDFIRFCCHMHIAEMLSARGGAGESRVVWRWPTIR
jgi:hypothetical protein